jgi:hypothetical protein
MKNYNYTTIIKITSDDNAEWENGNLEGDFVLMLL